MILQMTTRKLTIKKQIIRKQVTPITQIQITKILEILILIIQIQKVIVLQDQHKVPEQAILQVAQDPEQALQEDQAHQQEAQVLQQAVQAQQQLPAILQIIVLLLGQALHPILQMWPVLLQLQQETELLLRMEHWLQMLTILPVK